MISGGANAGHTLVVNGKQHALHLVPCGVLYSHTLNLLGNGVVVHLKTLIEVSDPIMMMICSSQELHQIEQHFPKASERSSHCCHSSFCCRVLISSRAHLVFDFHQLVDGCQEKEKTATGSALGTTKRGIGPCYASKMSRAGVRVCDLLDWPVFERKVVFPTWHNYGRFVVSSTRLGSPAPLWFPSRRRRRVEATQTLF